MSAIKYVVVLMLENRSYDNILGALYDSGNAPPFNVAPPLQAGLNGLTLSGPSQNSNPNGTGSDATQVPVANQTAPTQVNGTGPAWPPTTIPLYDAGEWFRDMAQQILGLPGLPPDVNPPKVPPTYSGYSLSNPSLMQGFVNNYQDMIAPETPPPAANVPDVMNYFRPAQVPVTSFLARNYAVCDCWFASAPTQTFTNRAFALTAASAVAGNGNYSFIDDVQYSDDYDDTFQVMPSLLQVLDGPPGVAASGPNWKIYFHDYSISMDTVKYVNQQASSSSNDNVSTFDGSDWGNDPKNPPTGLGALPPMFITDVSAGTLPPFSLIEPRYGHSQGGFVDTPQPPNTYAPNSNHPGPVNNQYVVGAATQIANIPNPPIDVSSGELLLMQVYNLLQASSMWSETLLIVTYDEHGGLYDHVPPQPATPPGVSIPSGDTIPSATAVADLAAFEFDFSVFGGRVPALVISQYTTPGSAISVAAGDTPYDHTSIISTVWDIFGITTPASLTNRDAKAPSLSLTLQPDVVNQTGQFGGLLVCSPGALLFSGSASQTIVASAGNLAGLAATAFQTGAQSPAWLTIDSSVGVISPAPGDIITIIVTVDASGLEAGTYTGGVVISGNFVSNSPMTVPVTLVVS